MSQRYFLIGCLLLGSVLVSCTTETMDNHDSTTENIDAAIDEYEEEILILEGKIQELQEVLHEREETIEELQSQFPKGEGEELKDVPSLHDDGFYEQHWMIFQKDAGEEFGFEPGTTNWKDSTVEVSGFTEGESDYTDLGPLVYDWIAKLNIPENWDQHDETAVRIRHSDQNSAEAIILQWGLKDDSLRGVDYLVNLKQSDGNWYIDGVKERAQCGRGVSEDGELCI